MQSIWQISGQSPQFNKLTKDIKTDILIIGGGIAGLLTAYMLKQHGADYTLLEARNIAGGNTLNTTAKITFQHGLVYQKILKAYGAGCAQGYLLSQKSALENYFKLFKNIECDLETKDSFVYTQGDMAALERELLALDRIGYKADLASTPLLPFKTEGAVKFKNQAQFNPIKLMHAISKELNIYQNSRVLRLCGNTAITDSGKVTAKRIVVATHFPFINKHGFYFLKMYQHRSYVIALKDAADVGGMYIGVAQNSLSLRNYNGYLLVGGGGHRTGEKGEAFKALDQFHKTCYPGAIKQYSWAAQDCMSPDGIPYIGRYSRSTPNLYVISGFSKWGMTNAMVAATLITDMLSGIKNPYAKIYDPSRSMLKPQVAVNALKAAKNLAAFTTKRCPHMGCALKYNKYEHSWDCACHGSRFTKDGKVIDNPANGDLKNSRP